VDGELRGLIDLWGRLWGIPQLASTVDISYNARLRSSLGRCRPSSGRVSLSAGLREASPERRAEVLCHEVAHVAAFHLYGPAAKPHGPEWQALVASAGFQPRVRSAPAAEERHSVSVPASTFPYEHRCPVCLSVRYARRPVPRWRCTECLDAGLGGELLITRRPPLSPGP
jgi:predicted SprT family Zn-dependent metalloprotease